jgi:hypothetical protein
MQPAQRARTRSELSELQARTRAEAQRRASRAESQYGNPDRVPMQAANRESLLAGGRENARYLNDISRTRRQFPVSDVINAGRWANPAMHVAQGSTVVGATADWGSAVAGQSQLMPDKPYSQGFENWKNSWAGGAR